MVAKKKKDWRRMATGKKVTTLTVGEGTSSERAAHAPCRDTKRHNERTELSFENSKSDFGWAPSHLWECKGEEDEECRERKI